MIYENNKIVFVDKTGKYAETIEELRMVLDDVGRQKSLAEFELVVQNLVRKGFINYVEGKGYTLSKSGVKEVEKNV